MSADTPDTEKGKTFTAKVRILEAVCAIEFPSEEEHRFRVAVMRDIGRDLKLAEVKNLYIDGTAPGRPRASGRQA